MTLTEQSRSVRVRLRGAAMALHTGAPLMRNVLYVIGLVVVVVVVLRLAGVV